MIRSFTYTLFLIFLFVRLSAQYTFYNYKHLTAEDGLPSTRTFDVAEDQYGFIWIATTNGLARYDGSKVLPLEQIHTDSAFLASSYVYSLLAAGDSLWIGTQAGLSILNLKSGSISNHSFEDIPFSVEEDAQEASQKSFIWDIYQDRQGDIWLAPSFNGFVKWSRRTQCFTRFALLPDADIPRAYSQNDQMSLRVIIQDVHQDSILWGGSMSGLVKLNQETGQITRIRFPSENENEQFRFNRKICMYQDPSGLIYSGSWAGGLSIFNPVSGEYTVPSFKLVGRQTDTRPEGHLFFIVPGEPGTLLLSYGLGLYAFGMADHSLSLLKRSSFKGDYEIRFGVRFIDSEGRAWYPSSGGLIMADPLVHQFRWFPMADQNPTELEILPRAIVEDFYPGYITLTGQYTDGIYHINLDNGQVVKDRFAAFMQKNQHFSAWGMDRLDSQRLLISEQERLYLFDQRSRQFSAFEVDIPLQYLILTQQLVDDYGTVWQGSRKDGLFSIDLNTRIVHGYQDQTDATNVSKPLQDYRGNIWMISSFGHLVFDREQEVLLDFNFNEDPSHTFLLVSDLCECPNGEVWMAGQADGLGLVDPKRPGAGMLKKIQLKNAAGKPLTVQSIACNKQNELWGMGSRGLLKIDRLSWTAEEFDLAYGIQKHSGMFQFLKNGDLFIGSRDGFYTVDPDQLIINTKLPRPYVTRITAKNGPKNQAEDHLNRVPVHLTAGENVVTIEFSAINYTLAEQTQFLYQLEGIDDSWKDPGAERSFTYSYLPGGDYVFKIKAANNEGLWNPDLYELPIHVGTPWYKTTAFWIILGMLLVGLVYFFYRLRIRQIHQANELRSSFEKRVAGLEMSALRAQMNPHFIFNCLSSIESYIIRNDTRKASYYLNSFGRLVRLILQNSRNSYISLEDELESIHLYLQLEQMRFKHKFTYAVELEEGLEPQAFEIPPMLIQPFLENAIWHGLNHRENGGELKVKISQREKSLHCVIEDNGVGRVAAARMRAGQKIKRKSMGMEITRERIETINKIYNTNNKVIIEDLYDQEQSAAGTRIVLIIPI